MGDLQSIVHYHEQVLRSMESQLAQRIETQQNAEARMDRFDRRMERAFRLGVMAYRQERRQRRELHDPRGRSSRWTWFAPESELQASRTRKPIPSQGKR